jgi:NAD(P)-dependent dehydrogenase (short-subunit alcohol dehydrogenase family)
MAEWTKRFGLEGKTALVTGACGGIGHEICRVLSDAGANIVAADRDPQGLAEVKAIVAKNSRTCATVTGDFATADGPAKVARDALAASPIIDILVNNAGIAVIEPLLDVKVEDWDRTMNINLRAPFLLAREVVPGMISRKRGKIINISSQAGVIGLDGHGAYCASKGGLNLLNSVCPTVILTPLGEKVWGEPSKGKPMLAKIPAERFGKPIEVADMVLYLASSASDLVNGHDMLIDGGYTAA